MAVPALVGVGISDDAVAPRNRAACRPTFGQRIMLVIFAGRGGREDAAAMLNDADGGGAHFLVGIG